MIVKSTLVLKFVGMSTRLRLILSLLIVLFLVIGPAGAAKKKTKKQEELSNKEKVSRVLEYHRRAMGGTARLKKFSTARRQGWTTPWHCRCCRHTCFQP